MALRYLLDTSICIFIVKQKPISVLERFEKLTVGEVAMSTITHGELMYGAYKSRYKKQTLQTLEELSHLIPTLPLSTDVGIHYGEIRDSLEKTGKLIGNNDLWIAAHALSLKTILVTNNEREFLRIKHLKVENWC